MFTWQEFSSTFPGHYQSQVASISPGLFVSTLLLFGAAILFWHSLRSERIHTVCALSLMCAVSAYAVPAWVLRGSVDGGSIAWAPFYTGLLLRLGLSVAALVLATIAITVAVVRPDTPRGGRWQPIAAFVLGLLVMTVHVVGQIQAFRLVFRLDEEHNLLAEYILPADTFREPEVDTFQGLGFRFVRPSGPLRRLQETELPELATLGYEDEEYAITILVWVEDSDASTEDFAAQIRDQLAKTSIKPEVSAIRDDVNGGKSIIVEHGGENERRALAIWVRCHRGRAYRITIDAPASEKIFSAIYRDGIPKNFELLDDR